MNGSIEITVAAALSVCSAVLLISGAIEKIVKAVRTAKAPNERQNARLDILERWREEVENKLRHDHERLENIEEGNRATARALLALLDHGIDGNNIKQMQDAKEGLQNHLINR